MRQGEAGSLEFSRILEPSRRGQSLQCAQAARSAEGAPMSNQDEHIEQSFETDFLEHISVCASQYDLTCRRLATELLESRARVRELEQERDRLLEWRECDTKIINWAQPRIEELRDQRDAARSIGEKRVWESLEWKAQLNAAEARVRELEQERERAKSDVEDCKRVMRNLDAEAARRLAQLQAVRGQCRQIDDEFEECRAQLQTVTQERDLKIQALTLIRGLDESNRNVGYTAVEIADDALRAGN
jgi:chromosome segregation ATPase